MAACILAFEQRVRELEKRNASLLSDSTNSSKPLSSDGPQASRPKKKKSLRSPGGQKGHKGSARELLAVEEMDHVHHLYPQVCEQRRAPLDPGLSEEPSEPQRYQHFEIPEITPIKTEYCLHELRCLCGFKTRAAVPAGVSRSSFGPRVHAAAAYLCSVHKAGRRGIVEIMNTLFGLNLCLGSVANMLDRVSPELEPVVEETRETLAEAGVLNIDEAGWKCKGARRFLWVFVSPLAVYFHIAASRGAKVLRSVLGDAFKGVITSDDHSAYASYHKEGVRPAVQWRKLCFGNQSDAGERFMERILTVTRTGQLQGRNAFEFLSDLMNAALMTIPDLRSFINRRPP
jgi:transposase